MVISLSLNDSARNILNDILKIMFIWSCWKLALQCLWWFLGGCHPLKCNLSDRWHGNVLLEQPSQYLAPSKGCADLVFFRLLLWQNPQLFLPNVFNMLFPCIQVFSQEKTSVSGQQLALWLLMDWMFSLFGGSYITPFRRVLLFQDKSAVIHKVA